MVVLYMSPDIELILRAGPARKTIILAIQLNVSKHAFSLSM